jgi:RNA polymerase sigma factor (sigma-70 family)
MARLANPELRRAREHVHRRHRRAGRFEFDLKIGSNVRLVITRGSLHSTVVRNQFLALIHRGPVMEIPSTNHSLLAAIHDRGVTNSNLNRFDETYREVILAWCRGRGLRGDAEDATQEILLKLSYELPAFVHDSGRGKFRSWLKTLVYNAVTDRFRKNKHRVEPAPVGGSAFQQKLENQAEASDETGELSEDLMMRLEGDLEKAYGRVQGMFEPKTWQAYRQLVWEQRDVADIARDLELKAETIKRHAKRVRAKVEQEANRILMERT